MVKVRIDLFCKITTAKLPSPKDERPASKDYLNELQPNKRTLFAIKDAFERQIKCPYLFLVKKKLQLMCKANVVWLFMIGVKFSY